MRHNIEFKPRALRDLKTIPPEEFEKGQEELGNYEDLKSLRAAKAKEAKAPTVSLDEARRRVRKI